MISKNYNRIADGLREGYYRSNPVWSANDLSILAGEYAWICGQLEEILMKKPVWWNAERDKVKSDTACEKRWQQTEDGINEMGLRLRMKGIEKCMSALKSLLRVAEGEMKNLI
jgi:hypothetical protein